MKNLNTVNLPRMEQDIGMIGDSTWGRFKIDNYKDFYLVLASTGLGFDHVSVSRHKNNGSNINKCPTLDEMKMVKNLFFKEDEIVYQIFPKEEDYVNEHPYCLHLWRPTFGFPLPPKANDLAGYPSIPGKIELPSCICKYTLVDSKEWQLLRFHIETFDGRPIKSGPTWEQTCAIKELVFGKDVACAEYMFDSTTHETTTDIYLPKDPNLLILPPSIMVGLKKKYTK